MGGLAWDRQGRLYIGAAASPVAEVGRVFVIERPGQKPAVLAKGLQAATGLCLDRDGQRLLVADALAGTLTALPLGK
jgi:sugar lactone lactonase YvrE